MFRERDKVVILPAMIEATVIEYYDGKRERVRVLTKAGNEWLIREEKLVHLTGKFTEK